ncbi:Nn.00g028600.m01.CDS01 [Neocucurbitaria sp. VM-36]
MKEEDILARQSRPQQYSTWVPKTRDWRYATGVFQHDDFDDDPKDRSAWDAMDYDYQRSGSGARYRRDILSRSRSASGNELGADEATNTMMASPDSASPNTHSLTARLRFTGSNIAKLRRIVDKAAVSPQTPQNLSRTQSLGTLETFRSPKTPATTQTAGTLSASFTPHSTAFTSTFSLFHRSWTDETQDFNIKTIRSTLQGSGEEIKELGAKYHWYTDAVPIYAIFPPGVPLSAKEINAYYPHHVRWKGVMIRLTKNGYRGSDIMGIQALFRGPPTHAITTPQMNTFQRDTVKSTFTDYTRVGYKGSPDRNLYTDQLVLGKTLENQCKGFTLPSFDDLLNGLRNLPSGLDARGLTQCLAWYLNIRDSFTPKLDLNVLHTQALIRALRQPLKPFGPQNLDRNALQEWRDNECFEERKIQEVPKSRQVSKAPKVHERTQLHMNLDNDSVQLHLTLPVQRFLTFPFLALHGIVCEAFKMGIAKAQLRQAERKGEVTRRALEAKIAARLAEKDIARPEVKGDTSEDNKTVERDQHTAAEKPKPYRIPKRPRPADEYQSSEPSPRRPNTAAALVETHVSTVRRGLTGPRAGHTISETGNNASPSSTYMQRQQPFNRAYDRRDYQSQSSPRSTSSAYRHHYHGA